MDVPELAFDYQNLHSFGTDTFIASKEIRPLQDNSTSVAYWLVHSVA